MDKNAIKKYAVWARTELITRVSQRAEKYDITADADVNATSVNGVLLSDAEKKQRRALIEQVKQKGLEQVMEEVAYTWFNRFIALRFMEVNGYLPSHIRVFTDDNNEFKPQILAEAIHLELDGLDMEKVYEMKNANENDELYKYLIITQCNDLSKILPGMFQKISDYTELLFPDNILREGSVIEQMVTLIPEDDWKSQVQIVGWLYQYYNSEPKDKVFAALKKNVKITKENIPAATQLFTPDWIVRYMVENSLGKIWVEGHNQSSLSTNWKYYLEEVEQNEGVEDGYKSVVEEYSQLRPEDILCIDPCSGSGHILSYMFDVLVQIYEDYGISTRDAVKSIVQNNIWGLDIDDRAAQLANFSVMMKAVQYDRRFLSRKDMDGNPDVPQPHVISVRESNNLDKNVLDYFCNDASLRKDVETICIQLSDAKEYGSIIETTKVDFDKILLRFKEIENEISIYKDMVIDQLYPIILTAQALSQKYNVVVTNPPYMGAGGMSAKLSKYVKEKYAKSKSDMFAVFIERCEKFTKKNYFSALITQHSWMFLASFEELRKELIDQCSLSSMLHLGTKAFDPGEVGTIVQTTSFVLRKTSMNEYKAVYGRLVDYGSTEEKEKAAILKSKDDFYSISFKEMEIVPNRIFAYWLSKQVLNAFNEKSIEYYADTKKGILSGNNAKFVRYWFEPDFGKVNLEANNYDDMMSSGKKWFPITSGGYRKKWYGNLENVVNLENEGYAIKNEPKNNFRLRENSYYCRQGFSWSEVAGNYFSVRYVPNGVTFGNGGPMGFAQEHLKYIIGFLNSKVANAFLLLLAPTLNFGPEQVKQIPLIISDETYIDDIVSENIALAKTDWDSNETAWGFKKHPLIPSNISGDILLKDEFERWKNECDERFDKLKANEEAINRFFIDLYGQKYELDEKIGDDEVTLHKADLSQDVKGLISYAVGCMFGRYSLDEEGLQFAGGSFESNKYKRFSVDQDNIIPICDDEYFNDDIANRFFDFIDEVYGHSTLEDNLSFISDAIGGKATPRENIRLYFLNNFYADHLKMYQKHPIYWFFDSGKNNGFKCLIYLHRYQPDTIARIRTDYVHEQQSRYRTAIEETENRLLSASGSDKVKLDKKLKKLKDQDAEIHSYEEKIHHLADQMIAIDLDDGVKTNYAKFQDVLAKIK